MLDDDQDKQMMRNQMRAIILITALLFGWYYWFVPQQQPVLPPLAQDAASPAAPVPSDLPAAPGVDTANTSASLPPAAEQTDPAQDEVAISDDYLELVFTKVGARLKRASLLLGENGKDTVQLVPQFSGGLDTGTPYPLGLSFTDPSLGDALDVRRFESEVSQDDRSVTFSIILPDSVIRKRFSVGTEAHVLDVQVEYENKTDAHKVLGMDANPAYTLNWGPNLALEDNEFGFAPQFIWRAGTEGSRVNDTLEPGDLPVGGPRIFPGVEWIGFKTKYFMVGLKPETDTAYGFAQGNAEAFEFGLGAPRFEVAAGAIQRNSFRIYLGPMELASLDTAWKGLSSALTFFTMFETMDIFAKFLLSILHWLHHNVYANYGIAIVLLTVLVRTLMLPLTLRSMKSMKKMQALQPEMEALREKHKDDQQELGRKMMEMYRERGVNPMGGCFPMLLQMPIFIALYRMLWNAFEMRGAPFLWIDDLSRPDRLLQIPALNGVPYIGQYIENINVLPILMAFAMLLNMKIMPQTAMQRPEQKIMMNIMPVMFSVFCYNLAAGLNLYVLTSTMLGIVQQVWITNSKAAPAPEIILEKTEKKRKQHPYNKVMQQKREAAKEAKRLRRRGITKSDGDQ